jgi:lysophospholipase L1-like esterase
MENSRIHRAIAVLALVLAGTARAALGDPSLLGTGATGDFALVRAGAPAPLLVAPNDWPGVRRAAGDLQADIERVTGQKPALGTAVSGATVIIGTLGRSEVIDGLVAAGKLDAAALRGRWEAFLIETVDRPMPGVDQALIIAGSDKRGTIYGIYELSQQIGVSPWYWWADVPPAQREALFIRPGRRVEAGPAVKYRGLFLNDEHPNLTNWVRAKFGNVIPQANPRAPANIANYGREFYTRLFEVMLRLRANYLWPAMWNNAFNEDDPENARLADEYGIVMGTSHQEPMLRAQKEWDWRYKQSLGSWNYARHPGVLEDFWREGVRRNKAFESIVTMGLRGADDTEMAPGGPEANRALLEKIVGVQRDILRAEVNPDISRVPQVWCLYKEVQEFYEHGMRVPDDVTLLWAEDNWGNLRRLPTAAERGRSGGAGIYYHFDYHGGPRSYQWLNTSPLPKIWEQMSMAREYGADRIWIVNVGHFKGYEFPLEYFLSLGWDTGRWGPEDFDRFTRLWAEREFGAAPAAGIADIVAKYSKYNGRRKPEMLAPDTYSLTDYREAETVVADYHAIAARAEEIAKSLPPARQDAFYQLVLFPAKAGALVNKLYFAAGRNALFARQGRASANEWAAATRTLFQRYLDLIGHYNGTFAGGKWAHFMDQPVLGYTTWRDPPKNNLDHLKLLEPAVPAAAALGVAVEGTAAAAGSEARLPQFDAFNRQRHYIDVFNRGQGPLEFTATAGEPWIQLSAAGGPLADDQRLWVGLDWSKVPAGRAAGTVKIAGGGSEVRVQVEAVNPAGITRDTLVGFVEANGHVSIEPEHYTRATGAGGNRWFKVGDYGRTLSGMKAWGPVDAPAATPGKDSPCLEYRMYLFTAGEAEVTAITAPTLNFIPDRGVRYAVSFDDEAPQVVTLVPPGYQAQNRNRDWEKSVGDNAHYGRSRHRVMAPGYHTLKIWMIDPAVVMQKLIVDLGGLKPSYLGPPESYRGPAPARSAADQPAMRGDRNSQLAHEQLLEKARAGGISLYFLGDSITRRWGAADYPDFLAHWKQSFHGWNAGNFGWGGDSTQHMLWRLQNGELDGVNPKVIVLLAGTNNIGKEPGDDAKVADVTRGVTALVNLCREKAPGAVIILMGILPRNDGPVVPTIDRINANLAKLADGRTVRYLNINDRLADAQGRLFDGMTVDQLHLSRKGYQVWAEALKPILTELLGPPAATDTAPPPTGDPSAKR